MMVEDDRLARKMVEVRRTDPGVSVSSDVVAAERVADDENDVWAIGYRTGGTQAISSRCRASAATMRTFGLICTGAKRRSQWGFRLKARLRPSTS